MRQVKKVAKAGVVKKTTQVRKKVARKTGVKQASKVTAKKVSRKRAVPSRGGKKVAKVVRKKTVSKKVADKTKAYAAAGVDVDLYNELGKGIKKNIKSTLTKGVVGPIGGFGGLFDGSFKGMKEPVLVSSIDGVGTKLKVASMAGKHDTIGADLVNHCVNDIAVLGAKPLFFLDYFGCADLKPEIFSNVVKGLAKACRKTGVALVGGETAQMPGVYHGEDYDLVGTIVGVVDRKKIIDGSKIKEGNVVLGFPSSGLHTNGYSLARKVCFETLMMKLDDEVSGSKKSLGEVLLETHVNYQPLLETLSGGVKFRGIAHITGGGFLDNIPRVLPSHLGVEIQRGSWPVLPIFKLLQEGGSIEEEEMYQAFNMGIGMVVMVSKKDAAKIEAKVKKVYRIGEVVKGNGAVKLV